MGNNDMNKEDFIKFCRYYKGEDECKSKDADVRTIFKIETTWVHNSVAENTEFFKPMLIEYIRAGLQGFEQFDNTPITLKIVLFNRFTQYNGRVDIETFKAWYKKHYSE